MNKLMIKNKGIICGSALLLMVGIKASAQQKTDTITPMPVTGKTYLKKTLIHSESLLQNGATKLSINSVSSITRSCKFESGSGDALTATWAITKLTDSITSGISKFYFNSENVGNTNDKISLALTSMVGKEYEYVLNKKGVITSVNKTYPTSSADSILSFAGLEQEDQSVGKKFPFIAEVTTFITFEIGKRWGDTVNTAHGRAIGEYWIEKNEGPVTVLAFIKTITDGGLNTQSTGKYTIDNLTGIVVSREIKNITTGYLTYKGFPYISTRRSNITENCALME